MMYFIKKIQILFALAFLLNACDGEMLFKTKPCAEGTVRKGNICLSEGKSEDTCINPDLSKVYSGERLTLCDGTIGVGTLTINCTDKSGTTVSNCSTEGQIGCVTTDTFKSFNFSTLTSDKLLYGETIGGVSGSLRRVKQCRNYSALGTFDASYPPTVLGWNNYTFGTAGINTTTDEINISASHWLFNNSPIRISSSGTMPAPLIANTTYYAIYITNSVLQVASTPSGSAIDLTTQGTGTLSIHEALDSTPQYFDTIDDFNNGGSLPSANPWGGEDYLCDSSNFENITGTSAPLLPSGIIPANANKAFTQIWRDKLTGLLISNILYDGVPNNRPWSYAVTMCEALNGASAGNGWRLPTEKELLQMYIDGISKVSLSGGSTANPFWSSSGSSSANLYVWSVSLHTGAKAFGNRYTTSWSVLCVR